MPLALILFSLYLTKLIPNHITNYWLSYYHGVEHLFYLLRLPSLYFMGSTFFIPIIPVIWLSQYAYRFDLSDVSKNRMARLMLFGLLLLQRELQDILYAKGLVSTGYVASYAMLGFVLIHASVLSLITIKSTKLSVSFRKIIRK